MFICCAVFRFFSRFHFGIRHYFVNMNSHKYILTMYVLFIFLKSIFIFWLKGAKKPLAKANGERDFFIAFLVPFFSSNFLIYCLRGSDTQFQSFGQIFTVKKHTKMRLPSTDKKEMNVFYNQLNKFDTKNKATKQQNTFI